jgi:hypothetical protein
MTDVADHATDEIVTSDEVVQVHVHPSFGPYIDLEVTPDMMRGKLIWIARHIRGTRRLYAEAQTAALHAKQDLDDAFDAAYDEAIAGGAKSMADADRTAKRITRGLQHAKENADLAVRQLADELDEIYKAQIPTSQSLNRHIFGEAHAEWGAAGHIT